MRGALLRNFHLYTRKLHICRNLKPQSINYNGFSNTSCKNYTVRNVQLLNNFPSRIRFLSSENGGADPGSKPEPESSESKPEDVVAAAAEIEEVDTEELKKQIKDYLNSSNDDDDDDRLPKILDFILNKLSGKQKDTIEKFVDELNEVQPSEDSDASDSESPEDAGDVADGEVYSSDFEDEHETDEDIGLLIDAEDVVMKKMSSDPYFNMNDKKWDDFVKEAMEHGDIGDTRECEQILEDMHNMDKLLPDDTKKKVEEKFNEIGDMVERGELSVEEGYELFKEFEDQLVMERAKQMEAEGLPEFDNDAVTDEGPTLRWQTRVVFIPGGDSWHPKNRKVKLATTVKEYGLSKAQFVRLRELVGKRYNPGKDELTIISERFEHREENRKDCLRTLLALMEEARKAEDLVHEARVSDIKNRLKANPKFMLRLQSKKQAAESKPVAA